LAIAITGKARYGQGRTYSSAADLERIVSVGMVSIEKSPYLAGAGFWSVLPAICGPV